MEVLVRYGSESQRKVWLEPLLAGKIRSCFAMTEPDVASSDATNIRSRIERDGDDYVINGRKWWTSGAMSPRCELLIVMGVTDPDAERHRRQSMILVPKDAAGVRIERSTSIFGYDDGPHGGHAEVVYDDVRVPATSLLGEEGDGFRLAQERLGPGRIHHAMRWLGQSGRAFDMLCERAVSRYTHGSVLADKQMVQDMVATSAAEMQAARLLTLHAAWTMDQVGASNARVEIAMIKYWGARVLHDVIDRAIQVHGSLGFSGDLPLEHMYRAARAARIYDGPDEVHKATVARRILRGYTPREVPTEHVPTRAEAARRKLAAYLDVATADL
jgi:acyl-CoA dehydrogenase